ncbi:hypothetical protein NQ315_012343 [Exocentrus adspersus]|uniref:THAP-type domain-containing protein n=1 Tax=Exocentrus adspersus TaxID=1586481 RepID=A0AAV8V9A1_9CUCU|nr:hypothetical protein NQ315_012343 [Exocentrus adspersus]
MTSKGGTSCICRWCPSKTGHGISLFTLPRDPTRLRLWLQACNREDLLGKDANTLHKCYRICENHFEEKFLSKGGTRKTLFAEAMPTIFLHNITKVKSAVTNSHVYEKSSNKIVVTSGESIVTLPASQTYKLLKLYSYVNWFK